MKDNRERVIFRRNYDKYTKIWKCTCIFPDDKLEPGRMAYVYIWKEGDYWLNDCYDEADRLIIDKHKITHKGDPIVAELIETLKEFYGSEYKVVEKIRG